MAELHDTHKRFVPILDPGIPLLPGYAPYEDGIKQGVFLRDVTGSPYIGEVRSCCPGMVYQHLVSNTLPLHGQQHVARALAFAQVWPGAVHFPDFLSKEGQSWWQDQVTNFYDQVKFDGLWVDMNEPSNFCTGHVCELPPAGLMDFVDHSACLYWFG